MIAQIATTTEKLTESINKAEIQRKSLLKTIVTAFDKKQLPPQQHQPIEPPAIEAKKISNIKWLRLILGIILAFVGIGGMIFYAQSLNMMFGILAIVALVPGVFLIYFGINRRESGYQFASPNKQYTGKENTIAIYARYDPETKQDIPELIDFIKMVPLPDSRLHYLRNKGKHYYEYMNMTGQGKDGTELKSVVMPDKKLCTPEAFAISSNMPRVQEYMEDNPGTTIQKIAVGALILAMGIIGILMVMTTPAQVAAGG